MRIDATLGDKPQVWQPVEQVLGYAGSLAKKYEGFSLGQSIGQDCRIGDVIGPHGDIVT